MKVLAEPEIDLDQSRVDQGDIDVWNARCLFPTRWVVHADRVTFGTVAPGGQNKLP